MICDVIRSVWFPFPPLPNPLVIAAPEGCPAERRPTAPSAPRPAGARTSDFGPEQVSSSEGLLRVGGNSPFFIFSAENAVQTCRKCGTPYENRQVVENGTTGELQVVGACYYNESNS